MPTPVEKLIGGLRVESTPLLFEYAQSLLPTMMEIVAIASQDLAVAVATKQINPKGDLSSPEVMASIFPALRNLAAYLQGKLEVLAPKVMATTRVAAPISSGEMEWHELSKVKDRAYIFDEYPQLYMPILVHAGVVTFSRFFPELGRRGREAAASTSKDSSPST